MSRPIFWGKPFSRAVNVENTSGFLPLRKTAGSELSPAEPAPACRGSFSKATAENMQDKVLGILTQQNPGLVSLDEPRLSSSPLRYVFSTSIAPNLATRPPPPPKALRGQMTSTMENMALALLIEMTF